MSLNPFVFAEPSRASRRDRSWRAPTCIALAGVLGFACGEPPLEVDTQFSSVVAREVFERAFGTVSRLDYLPFQFRIDGCYARALYMSMELASERIESNSIFAFANPEHPLRVGEVEWAYHVAPMLEVQTDEDARIPMVIDPSISDEPMSSGGWLDAMGHGPARSRPVNEAPQVVVVPGSRYSPLAAMSEEVWLNRDIPSFEALPPFKMEDVQNACGVMHAYLGYEPREPGPQGEALTREKRATLLSRTRALVRELSTAQKLEGDAPFSAEACAATEIDPFAPF